MINFRFELKDTVTPRARRAESRMRGAVIRGVANATLLLEREWKRKLSGPKTATTLGVISGALLGDVKHRFESGGLAGIVGLHLIYGRAHEFGATILPKHGEFLVFRIGDRLIFARRVVLPKRPHLAPAFRDARPQMRDAFRQSLREALAP